MPAEKEEFNMDIIVGEKRNPNATNILITSFEEIQIEGTLYIGYPILSSVEDVYPIDALLVSVEHGLVVFDLNDDMNGLEDRQSDFYAALQRKLLGYKALREGRGLLVDTPIVTFSTQPMNRPQENPTLIIATPQTLKSTLEKFKKLDKDVYKTLNAAIERVTTIKPVKKRSSVSKVDSKGAILKRIEREIANLDKYQKQAAIESPEGPQRVRGLAGAGKTVVLALKAAYLHARNPDWKIAITFNTRSLYQQFRDLVRRFYYDQTMDEPDWEKIQIMHGWGSKSQLGVYYDIALAANIKASDFQTAKYSFGQKKAFEGVCADLLKELKKIKFDPIYDAVLIDEAQDFPQPFFELIFKATKTPSRIVWAYDELQNLSQYFMLPPSELFGIDDRGKPNVPELNNVRGEASQDLVLPVCYRNTPWALTIAHALGFGIYRSKGLVQFFEDSKLWEEVGYEVVNGELSSGKRVSIQRKRETAPNYFYSLLHPEDAVMVKGFKNNEEQLQWVAQQIKHNLEKDELSIDDILVIFPDPLTVGEKSAELVQELRKLKVDAHIVGVTLSRDLIFSEESVAISGIFRAKGNEAAMVYILNSDFCADGWELPMLRNTLFTAITRSRAWVRVCGLAPGIISLKSEIDEVIKNKYQLEFNVPTKKELEKIRRVHRELSPSQRDTRKKLTKNLNEALSLLENDISPDEIPESIRKSLLKKLKDS